MSLSDSNCRGNYKASFLALTVTCSLSLAFGFAPIATTPAQRSTLFSKEILPGGSTRRSFTTNSLFQSSSSTNGAKNGDDNNNNNNDNNNDNVLDVLVCGAGPAGLLLAKELGARNLKVAVVDPALDKPWPNNYGVWMDEADYYGYADCVDRVWNQVGIVFDEATPELVLTRPYGRVDRKTMKARLMEECRHYNVQLEVAKAVAVEHFEDQPSIVTTISMPSSSSSSSSLSKDSTNSNNNSNNNTNNSNKKEWKALLVADATGFAREFVKHDVEFDPGYQVTYGARFRVNDLGPYQMDRMVLMDFSEQHLYSNPALTKSNIRFPSFVYVMPLADNEIFLEETVLVSRPGASSRDLQARLELRMKALGINPIEVLEDERAAIPMGGMDPVVPQRTLGFGATSSLVHPASGYMVARAMEIAPRVAQAIATSLQTQGLGSMASSATNGANGGSGTSSSSSTSSTSITIKAGQLDEIAKAGWNAVWPTDERRQRDFMHFGFELLCRLNPQELRDFFTGFFRLPNGLWEHFLSWRLSGVGHIVMGITVWATCIPKRFMPSMLLNSLPFIGNRLVGPFASRGNFAKIDTDSLYADARTGNATMWEPDEYYPYVDELSKKDFGFSPTKNNANKEEDTPTMTRTAANSSS